MVTHHVTMGQAQRWCGGLHVSGNNHAENGCMRSRCMQKLQCMKTGDEAQHDTASLTHCPPTVSICVPLCPSASFPVRLNSQQGGISRPWHSTQPAVGAGHCP